MATIVDWGALLQVIWISAAAGISIALVLGVGIVASLRAQDHKGNVLALNAVTRVPVRVAVPPDDEPSGHAAPEEASASARSRSWNSMVGQSFQSLSRA